LEKVLQKDESNIVAGWQFNPIIINTGNTPTRNLEFLEITPNNNTQIIANYDFDAAQRRERCISDKVNVPLGPDVFFHAKARRPQSFIDMTIAHFVLGPKDSARMPELNDRKFTFNDFKFILDKGKGIRFFYGVIKYKSLTRKGVDDFRFVRHVL